MAQPTYGAPWRPLADVYGQQWVFEPLTSDPANTENGDHWLRVDLDSGDKLATLRWDHGSGIWDVPVFPVGDSGSGVEEVLRVQTPNGLGFVPVLDSGAAFQQVGFQHAGTRYGFHDSVTAIPDSGISHLKFEQDLLDAWGSNDATDNSSAGYTTDASVDSYAKVLDGVDDWFTVNSPTGIDINDISISIWIYLDDLSTLQPIVARFPQSGNPGQFYLKGSEIDNSLVFDIPYVTGNVVSSASNALTTGQWIHCVYTRSGDTHTLYIDGQQDGQTTDTSSFVYDGGLRWGTESANGEYLDGRVDDSRFYSKALTATEVSNLYNTGSISG